MKPSSTMSGQLTGLLFIVSSTIGLLSGFHILNAQQWQYVYGDDNIARQVGQSGVTPVTGTCAGVSNGYIAVGYTYYVSGAPTPPDVYVVRTDNNGAMVWERTYDVDGNNGFDDGASIIELSDGTGFVITGRTGHSSGVDAFLMKIDCNGAVLWTQIYPGPTIPPSNRRGSGGNELIETTTGDPNLGTSPGDIVVCGFVTQSDGDTDALLFRTDASGNLLWNASYDGDQGEQQELYSLAETTPTLLQTTGDIIGVGMGQTATPPPGGGYDAYVVRVNGNSGQIGAAPQGAATYGNPGVFYSVIELQNPGEIGPASQPNVVLAGGILGEILLVKLNDGDPCTPALQSRVGDGTTTLDVAYDVQEIPFQVTGVVPFIQWDLILAGESHNAYYRPIPTSQTALLQGINPTTLTPIPAAGQLYGPNVLTNSIQWGQSVAPVDATGGRTQGFIMCGFTQHDWLSAGDAGDVYLLKTDMLLSTVGCEISYNPDYVSQDEDACFTPSINNVLNDAPEFSTTQIRDWGDPICTSGGGGHIKATPDIDENASTSELTYGISVAGNPVRSDGALQLRFNGEELPSSVGVHVADAHGKSVLNMSSVTIDGSGILTIPHAGWPSGVYFVTVSDQNYQRVLRVIVLE